jgi:hypothetical protein
MKNPRRVTSAQQIRSLEERALFLTLFYRERVGRLADRLTDQVTYAALMRKRGKKNKLKQFEVSIEQVAKLLSDFIVRAEDGTCCNDICSSMYFCDLKRGHKGPHAETYALPGECALKWD